MIQYIYASSSVRPFTELELRQLLDKSRRNNEEQGITGMLLYKDGLFMQALEGEKDQVDLLRTRIALDPRHRGLTTLQNAPCTTREFPVWSMGFYNLTKLDPRDVPGYSRFLDSPLLAEEFVTTPSLALSLLLLFKGKLVHS